MEIVILDGLLANPGDLSWKEIDALGNLTVFDQTSQNQIIERCREAEVVIVNKIKLNKSHFEQLQKLKLICLLATGYDNINIEDAAEYNIGVANAVGYSTDSVAEHVFSLIMACNNRIAAYNKTVQEGRWYQEQWSYTLAPIPSLKGKVLGIYGFGKIGRRVAELGLAFGMEVISHHKHPERDATNNVSFVSLEEVFAQSDIISLHAPLSDANRNIVNTSLLSKMKEHAILINTGRGGLIQENDLRNHLLQNKDTMAGLDVLSTEPPQKPHPLIGVDNCIITPHIAWSNVAARKQLLSIVASNITSFQAGERQNRIS